VAVSDAESGGTGGNRGDNCSMSRSKGRQVSRTRNNGKAEIIVSGDSDLLALNPFRGIPIVTPAIFLQREMR
jgi:hypothetical protein